MYSDPKNQYWGYSWKNIRFGVTIAQKIVLYNMIVSMSVCMYCKYVCMERWRENDLIDFHRIRKENN